MLRIKIITSEIDFEIQDVHVDGKDGYSKHVLPEFINAAKEIMSEVSLKTISIIKEKKSCE